MSFNPFSKSNGSNFIEQKSENKTFIVNHNCDAITFARLATVLLLRAGYVLIQISSIPVNDVQQIIFQNIVDISVSTCSYLMLGYMFSFGNESLGGFIGSSSSFNATSNSLHEIIYGFSACLIGSSIITTILAGRLSSIAAACISFLNAGLLQPTVMHWVWNKKGWMAEKTINNIKLTVKDHAGTMVVHLASGTTALWGAVCLGRRLVRLKDLHESSLGPASPGLSFLGYMLIFIGLTTFALPRYQHQELNPIKHQSDQLGLILVNCMIASSSSCLAILLLQCLFFGRLSGHWTLLKCLQGAVAGLVTVFAGVDSYDRFAAFLISAVGAFFYYVITLLTETMFYEDNCNVLPAHFICGFLGAIFPTLVGDIKFSGNTNHLNFRIYQTLWQLMCACVIALWFTLFYLPLFVFLQMTGLLTNNNEELNHLRSLNVMRNIGNPTSIWRIFTSGGDWAPVLAPGCGSKSGNELDKLKERYERRREVLEVAMAKRQKKKSEQLTMIEQPPIIPAEEIVKDMGILESERYPASYNELMEERFKARALVYTALNNNNVMSSVNSVKNSSSLAITKTGVGVHIPKEIIPSEEVVKAEIHERQNDEKKRSSFRRKNLKSARQRTKRRKRTVKRLESEYSFTKTKRKE